MHGRRRAGRRLAQELFEHGVVLKPLTNVLGTLVIDVVVGKDERDAWGWKRSVRARVGRSASKPAQGRAHVRNTPNGRGRADGRRAHELPKHVVVPESLANMLVALVTDFFCEG